MPRRMTGWALAFLGLWLAQAAGAQTTSTSTPASSTTSTSPTPTSTTPATTSTTVPNPCDTQVCTDSPPSAVLSGSGGEVALDRGSSCWRSFTPDAEGRTSGICADRFSFEPDAELVVRQGETLTLRFSAMSPTRVLLQRGDTSTPLVAGNPVRVTADLPVGSHVVSFFTNWLQGDASYYVRLVVRPATTPRTGLEISLTG